MLNRALGSSGQEGLPTHHTNLSYSPSLLEAAMVTGAAMVTRAAVSLDLVFHLQNEPNPGRAQALSKVSYAVQPRCVDSVTFMS